MFSKQAAVLGGLRSAHQGSWLTHTQGHGITARLGHLQSPRFQIEERLLRPLDLAAANRP